jgi:hypothetical protein
MGSFDEAATVLAEAANMERRGRSARLRVVGHMVRAEVFRLAGDLDAAEQEAMTAAGMCPTAALDLQAHAFGAAAHIRLERGQWRDAIELARRATATPFLSLSHHGEAQVRNVLALALHSAGEVDAAHDAIRLARERLLERAQRISDPQLRESFLWNVPENARTLELAERWLGTA